MPNVKSILKIFLIILIVGIIFLSIGAYLMLRKIPAGSINQNSPEVKITYTNFAEVISGNDVVQNLPEGSTLLLEFYKFEAGERKIDKMFILQRGIVREGLISGEDIHLSLDSKYLDNMTTRNFCSIISSAKQNGDLGFQSSLSPTSLAWKFKSIYKYRDCFGF